MKTFFKLLTNQRGNTLALALMMVGTTTLLSLGTMQAQNILRDRTNIVRAKAKITAFENRLKVVLTQTAAYTCNYNDTQIQCSFNTSFINKYLTMRLQGPPCENEIPAGEWCGIVASNLFLTPPGTDSGTGQPIAANVTAKITINHINSRFHDIDLSVDVPTDVLQMTDLDCPTVTADDTRVVFKGFRENGSPICDSLPNPTCPPNTYITGIDPATGALTCTAFPNQTISCPAGQYISHIRWNGADNFDSPACTALPSPFSVFPVTDENNTISYTPPIYPAYNPPLLPSNPAPTSGNWTHSAWGATASQYCPTISLYGQFCSPRGYRCNQYHNNVGMETLICQ